VVFIEELGDQLKNELSELGAKLDELKGELPARWPLVVYLIGVSITLLCSATFHTFMCCGRNAYNNFARLDYAGVSVQIVTSVLVVVFYSFREPHQLVWRYIYLSSLLVIGLTLLTVMCLEYFAAWRQLRTFLFVLIGAFGLVPVVHVTVQMGVQDPFVATLVRGTVFTCLFYMTGVFIFISRLPERWWPGKFDLMGKSHEL
jgi:adiponectin receptor